MRLGGLSLNDSGSSNIPIERFLGTLQPSSSPRPPLAESLLRRAFSIGTR
jgi:hypothetical protein